MLTIIFLDDDNNSVSISFSKDETINPATALGYWNTNTNEIQLSIEAWNILQNNRNNIRALKSLMDKLQKIPILLV